MTSRLLCYLISFCLISGFYPMHKKQPIIVLLGAPGAGKGTYGDYLHQKYHYPEISTGDLLRKHVKEKTTLGKQAEIYMNQGRLVPDQLVFKILDTRLKEKDCKQGYILDGFPRTLEQAQAFDQMLSSKSQVIVLSLEVPEKEIIQRLTGRLVCQKCYKSYHINNYPPKEEGICDLCHGYLAQRNDDKEETIKKRLIVYEENTKPLKQYYKEKGLLVSINGNQPKEKTLNDIEFSLKATIQP